MITDSAVKPVIVGGQAVNVWAIAYLLPAGETPQQVGYQSGDLDVMSTPDLLKFLENLPGWRFEKRSWRQFADTRDARAFGVAEDGRKLLVEVLAKVNGLNEHDLKAVAEIEADGARYTALDPIAMLKAKAANVRTINQDGRFDRDHLKLIARCLPLYLRDLHAAAFEDAGRISEVSRAFNRAFATLQHRPTFEILIAEGISPADLTPPELANSPIEKIRDTYHHQMPRTPRPEIPG